MKICNEKIKKRSIIDQDQEVNIKSESILVQDRSIKKIKRKKIDHNIKDDIVVKNNNRNKRKQNMINKKMLRSIKSKSKNLSKKSIVKEVNKKIERKINILIDIIKENIKIINLIVDQNRKNINDKNHKESRIDYKRNKNH